MNTTVSVLFRRMNRFAGLILCLLAASILWMLAISDTIHWILRGSHSSVCYCMDVILRDASPVFPVIFLLCSVPGILAFYQEWEHGFWKMASLRTGQNRWIRSWMTVLVGTAIGICAASLCLVMIVLTGLCLINGGSFFDPAMDAWVPLPVIPLLYVLVQIMVFSLGAGLWAVVCSLIVVRFHDLFLALVMPVAFYSMLQYLMAVLLHRTLAQYLRISLLIRPFALSVVRSCVVLIGLTGLFGLLLVHALSRRMNDEIDP